MLLTSLVDYIRLHLHSLMQPTLNQPAVLQVQGVFFRDTTKQKADSLKIFGFCQNTSNNTVAGEIQASRGQQDQEPVTCYAVSLR